LQFEPERAARILTFIDKQQSLAQFWHQVELEDTRYVQRLAEVLCDLETAHNAFWFHYCESHGRNPQYWRVHSLEATARLYQAVEQALHRGLLASHSDETALTQKDMTRSQIHSHSIPSVGREEIDAHFHLLPSRYFETRTVEDVELHLELVHRLLETIQLADSLGTLRPVIDWRDMPEGGYSVITVVTWDRSGLFYKLAGAISAAGMNILKARAISREDHIAIDTFHVTEGKQGAVCSDLVKVAFEESITAILVEGEKAMPRVKQQYEISRKKANSLLAGSPLDHALPVKVEIYFDDELNHIVAEYQGRDRIGLLYQISRTLSRAHFNIDSVRIATNNGIATGTLLLTDESREKRNDPEHLEEVRERLIAILSAEAWTAA
jgi:[protein-PII] uridylyltransferase